MTYIIAANILIIGAAFVGMLWLRRVADEAWRRHRIQVAAAPIAKAFVELQISIADSLTPALTKAAAAVRDLATRFEREEAINRELARLILGGRPSRPELKMRERDR